MVKTKPIKFHIMFLIFFFTACFVFALLNKPVYVTSDGRYFKNNINYVCIHGNTYKKTNDNELIIVYENNKQLGCQFYRNF